MEQKLQRVIKACVEMGPQNPICSIHDQGAGGNGRFSEFFFYLIIIMNYNIIKNKFIAIFFYLFLLR